jgi:capsular polysaccharide export protein
MNILLAVYYLDSARYFAYLHNCIVANNIPLSVTFVCFYPSAYLYLRKLGYNVLFLPSSIKRSERATESTADLEALAHYQIVTLPNIPKELILNETQSCLSFYEKLFEKNDYDLFISSGDTRLQIRSAIQVARQHNVNILYFEQGPFGTTLIDHEGVNANVSFRFSTKDTTTHHELNIPALPRDDYRRSLSMYDKWLEKLDLLFFYAPPLFSRVIPIYSQLGPNFGQFLWQRLRNKFRSRQTMHVQKQYIFLPLQMPNDAQSIYHAPKVDGYSALISSIARVLPAEIGLVIREHPHYVGQYDKELYDIVERDARICLDGATPLCDLISSARVVVVVNSTVGLEALAAYKPLIMLGESYYDNCDQIQKPESLSDIGASIQASLIQQIDVVSIDQYLSKLMGNFIPGHFRDLIPSGGDLVVERILRAVSIEERGRK